MRSEGQWGRWCAVRECGVHILLRHEARNPAGSLATKKKHACYICQFYKSLRLDSMTDDGSARMSVFSDECYNGFGQGIASISQVLQKVKVVLAPEGRVTAGHTH